MGRKTGGGKGGSQWRMGGSQGLGLEPGSGEELSPRQSLSHGQSRTTGFNFPPGSIRGKEFPSVAGLFITTKPDTDLLGGRGRGGVVHNPLSLSSSLGALALPLLGAPRRNLETQGGCAKLVRKAGAAEAGWGWGGEETGLTVRKGTFWGFVPTAVWLGGKWPVLQRKEWRQARSWLGGGARAHVDGDVRGTEGSGGLGRGAAPTPSPSLL